MPSSKDWVGKSGASKLGPYCIWQDMRGDAKTQVEALVIVRIAPVQSCAVARDATTCDAMKCDVTKTSPKKRQVKATAKQRAGKKVRKVVGPVDAAKVKAAIAKVKAEQKKPVKTARPKS